ncbi:MAG TPA: iron ABC transporter permease [Vicinamibacterales bacterium]|nr:iron ABC transporter permease [Vicinamibacterales bacterium]
MPDGAAHRQHDDPFVACVRSDDSLRRQRRRPSVLRRTAATRPGVGARRQRLRDCRRRVPGVPAKPAGVSRHPHVSSGATLGAVVVITFHLDTAVLGISAVPVATFAGAAGALGIVYAMSIARRRGTSSTVLLLAGVALSAFLGALNRFIQVIGDYTDTFRSIRWMMGSMDVGSYTDIVVALVPIAAACIAIGTLPRELDLVSIGAEAAESRGVDVRRAERVALVSASLLTGSAVSLGGPIPFVGIIVPHIVRLIVGANHRLVLPAAALFGGAFLVICDVIARTAFGAAGMPVGAITAFLGGPFFLWLLFRRMR